jgi:hypothetical protein
MRRTLLVTSLLAGVMVFGSMPAHADATDDINARDARRGSAMESRQTRGSWQGESGYGKAGDQWNRNRHESSGARRNRGSGQFGRGKCDGGQSGAGHHRGGQYGGTRRDRNSGGSWNKGGRPSDSGPRRGHGGNGGWNQGPSDRGQDDGNEN